MVPYRSIHFAGVMNPLMCGLATYAAKSGVKVTASDDHPHALYQKTLEDAGITVHDMFSQLHVAKSIELVVLSPYLDERNVEVTSAQKQSISVMMAVDFLREIMGQLPRVITLGDYEAPLMSRWLAHIWKQSHMPIAHFALAPDTDSGFSHIIDDNATTFIAPLQGIKRDGHTYEPDFLSFEAQTIVVPSLKYTDPELYTTLDDTYQAYYRLARKMPRSGVMIGNSDWPRMKRLQTHLVDRKIETYGVGLDARWQIRDVVASSEGTTFYLVSGRERYGPFTIPEWGEHMVAMAAGIAITSLWHDIPVEIVGRGLLTLPKVSRYMEVSHDAMGRTIIDDCADHPVNVKEALRAIKTRYPDKKIWCLFQPQSYVRTKAMVDELPEALGDADYIYIADIAGYPKEKSEGYHARHLVAHLRRTHSQTFYLEPGMDMTGLLRDRVASQDCIVTLGAYGVGQTAVAPLQVSHNADQPVS
jgi:UDP-N-acetylmuramate--alanine ligase